MRPDHPLDRRDFHSILPACPVTHPKTHNLPRFASRIRDSLYFESTYSLICPYMRAPLMFFLMTARESCAKMNAPCRLRLTYARNHSQTAYSIRTQTFGEKWRFELASQEPPPRRK